jgi:acyl-CoA dehydrogenase
MDFELPPDTLMLRDMLRRFIQNEARPLEMKYFNTGELSPEELARLQKGVEQLGLWNITVPKLYGGGGLDTVTSCMIDEEIGKTFVPVEIGELTPLLYACQGAQVPRFLDPVLSGERRAFIAAREPGSLHPCDWQASAEMREDMFILNGHKLLSRLPDPADFFIALVKTIPNTQAGNLSAFILESGLPGISISNNGEPLLTMSDLRVPIDNILGELGGALRLMEDEAPRAWIRTGARYVGLVGRMIEMAVDHAKDWVSFGEPLAVRPAIQRMIAEMQVEVESVRWLVYHAAWLADKNQDTSIRRSAAKVRLASGEMLMRSMGWMTMIFAGPGPSPEIDPHRLAYGPISPEALDMTMEQARMFIAAELLGLQSASSEL